MEIKDKCFQEIREEYLEAIRIPIPRPGVTSTKPMYSKTSSNLSIGYMSQKFSERSISADEVPPPCFSGNPTILDPVAPPYSKESPAVTKYKRDKRWQEKVQASRKTYKTTPPSDNEEDFNDDSSTIASTQSNHSAVPIARAYVPSDEGSQNSRFSFPSNPTYQQQQNQRQPQQ